MAISLDGTTQSVRIGGAATATDVYRTRPFTIALLINVDNTTDSTYRALYSQDWSVSWGFSITDTDVLSFVRAGVDYASGITISSGTGWWLVGATCRDAAFNSPHDFFAYRYNTRTLTVEAGSTASVDSDPAAPGAGQETHVGQDKRSGSYFFGGEVGWVGIWPRDLTNAGSSTAPELWTLIVQGPWALTDSTTPLFVPMLRSNLIDFGATRHAIANVGGAGFVGGHATELPSGSVLPVLVETGAGAVTVTPGVAALTLTPLAPTVSTTAHQVATPGTAALTLTPRVPTVTASNHQTVTPGTVALTLTAQTPVVSVSNHQTVTPGPLALSLTPFAPTVTTTGHQTVVPGVAALTLTPQTPIVTTSGHVTVTPGTLALVLAPQAPTVTATSGVTVTPGMLALVLSGLAPSVITSAHQTVTPGTVALAVTFYAPTVTVSGGSGSNVQPYIVVYFWKRTA